MSGRTGQCLCGAVRFTADVVSAEFGVCHCRMCQRWAGGPFISAEAKNVVFESEEFVRRHQSSQWAERGFCSRCGSAIFYRFVESDQYEICVGTFDDMHDLVMSGEIFIDRKPDGYAFAGDHPRLTEAQTMAKFKEFST